MLQEAIEEEQIWLPEAPADASSGATLPGAPVDVGADAPADARADPVVALRNRAGRVLGAWANAELPCVVSVGGWPLPTAIVTSVGAIEVAVHGWDVACACGQVRPFPPLLAAELLHVAPLVVADADRPARFAAAVPVAPLASPGDRLLAFLGRNPHPTVRLAPVIPAA